MYIYCITNKINGKKYIGLTTNSIDHRWKEHIAAANSTQSCKEYALHRAIRKYGIDNFIVEQIDTASTEEELKAKESYYIGLYNTFGSKGYNMTCGGDLNEHLIGEKSPLSKNSDSVRWEIINLLQNTRLPMKEIALQVGLNSRDGEKLVSMINNGANFYQSNLTYPIRERGESKKGFLNPGAITDKETLLQIINLLETTNLSQKEIAKKTNVHYNTVSNINTCKRWTELHHYKNNIRKESKLLK